MTVLGDAKWERLEVKSKLSKLDAATGRNSIGFAFLFSLRASLAKRLNR